MNAYSGSVVLGHLLTVLFDTLNSADLIIISLFKSLYYCKTRLFAKNGEERSLELGILPHKTIADCAGA